MYPQLTCPQCKSPVEDNACTECCWSLKSVQSIYTQGASAPCHVELSLLIDRTGSGALFCHGVEISTKLILEAVEKNVQDLRVWVQTHGDEDYQEFPKLITAGCDVSRAVQAVQTIGYAGGGDGEETHLSAIESALESVDWQQSGRNTRRVMLAFVNDDTKPARSGRSATKVGQRLREAGILFYLICQPTGTLKALSQAARGMICEITNNPSPELMQAIATQISGSVIQSVSTGSAVPLPALLPPPSSRTPASRRSLLKRLPWSKR